MGVPMEQKPSKIKGILIFCAIAILAYIIFGDGSKSSSKPALKENKTELMSVQYCVAGDCSPYYTLQVENTGKSVIDGEYVFEFEWPNGGLQEASVVCGTDDIGRFCSGVGDGGRLYRFREI